MGGRHELPSLEGRVVVVTGANSGIGLETARALATRGAHVVLGCRRAEAAAEAEAEIRSTARDARLEHLPLDLADLDAVARFGEAVAARHPRLDLLIHNAGVMLPPPTPTAQGFEVHLGVNHLGPFALTVHLLPRLLAAPAARVVVVSSLAHRMGRARFDALGPGSETGWRAYGRSKLANLLFCFELDRRLKAAGRACLAVAAHPGYTNTELQRHHALIRAVNPWVAMSPPEGAAPTLRAATDPEVRGGDYFGPGGLGELRGPPIRVGSSALSRSRAAAEQLWAISEQATGLTLRP
jgi:NAD(P)-dependent dehydrogenase (short-subunit alcohol dehydrogenase family)